MCVGSSTVTYFVSTSAKSKGAIHLYMELSSKKKEGARRDTGEQASARIGEKEAEGFLRSFVT